MQPTPTSNTQPQPKGATEKLVPTTTDIIGELAGIDKLPKLDPAIKDALDKAIDLAVALPEDAARHWYRLLVGDRQPRYPHDPDHEQRLLARLKDIYPDDPQKVERQLREMRSERTKRRHKDCWGPDWQYLFEALAAHCGISPGRAKEMTWSEIAAEFKAAYERKAAANEATATKPKGIAGRRGYPLEALTIRPATCAENPKMKALAIRRECLKKFNADDLPHEADAFRRWLNRKRAN